MTAPADRRHGAAVDGVLRPGDGGGPVGDEERDQLGDLLGFGRAASGMPPSESMTCRSAWSREIPLLLAMRSTRSSAPAMRMKPGDTTLTRMPCGPSSLARPLLSVVSADFAAA